MKANKPDFRLVNTAETPVLYLYDVIGADFFGGISAKMVADELATIKGAKSIDVRINSPGGDVFDGNAIFTLLKSHGAKINVFVDGLAASIASVIAMAGDSIEISSAGYFMIHDPSGLSFGNSAEHRKMADLLDKIRDTIVDVYSEKSSASREQLSDWMSTETWFNAEESVANGFASAIGADQKVAACIDPRLFRYRAIPQNLTTETPPEPVQASPAEVLESIQRRIQQDRLKWREPDVNS